MAACEPAAAAVGAMVATGAGSTISGSGSVPCGKAGRDDQEGASIELWGREVEASGERQGNLPTGTAVPVLI